MATIYQSGYVFKDDGTAVEGATVQLYQADTTTTVGSSTTTSSAGYWNLSTTTEHTSGYDAKITSGSSVRYRRGNDRLQIEELDIRNDTGNGQGGLLVANTTNNASNKVATFAGRNSTRADNDEIYLSFEMNNSAGEIEEFARITAIAADVTDDEEDGQIKFGVSVDGTMTNVFTITSSESAGTDMNLDVSGDLTLDADGGDIFFKDGGTTFGSATNNSGNLIIKSGTTTALTFTGSSVAIAGDLTITGDDLVMGTNTDTAILVADGTNYNPVVPSGDVGLTNAGVFSIASGVIVNADVNSSAAIAVSKTALTAGTGLSLSTNTLSVDAAQTQITSVGTIGTGVWQGTAIASAYIAGDAITGAKIADDAIGSEHIADDAVVSAAIADDAITSALIADDAITSALIADNAVGLDELAGIARGKIIYGDASGNPAVLTVGNANEVLTSDGTDISWAAASSGVSVGKAIAFSLIF